MRALETLQNPPRGDIALASGFAALSQVEIWIFTADAGYSGQLRLAAAFLTLVASASLVYRRQRPALSFLVNALAVIGVIVVGYPSDVYQYTNLIALFSLAANATGWPRWAGLPLGVAGVLTYFARFPSEGGPALAAFIVAMWVVAWLAGRMYGARIEEARLRIERDLSQQLAEANEDRLVLEEERNRIARELHDIIGHTVNVMVVHADAGRREIDRDSVVAARAFDTIARTGRDALAELDRVLAVLLRDETEQTQLHTPAIDDLDRLATTFSTTGLPVDMSITGDRHDVPTSVGIAIYRIVQEALTNTLKHAAATRASVAVAVATEEVEVTVRDDGRHHGEIRPGRGLLGMRERVALHEGRLEFGPDDHGGFTVNAHMRWDTRK
jgi:signal transduction histidine kinase